jgi:hypothetical protein
MNQIVTIKLLKFRNQKEVDYLINILNNIMEIPLDRAGTHKSLLLALKEIKDNYAEIENSTE